MKHHTCNEVDKSVIREKEPKKKKKTISAYDMKEGAFFFFLKKILKSVQRTKGNS
jgi:hypothetical protein